MLCTLQVFHERQWHTAAIFEPSVDVSRLGYLSGGRFSYEVQYVGQYLNQGIAKAVSCRYPVSFALHAEARWPAFLLDILPSGAGRRYWLQQLKLHDGPMADWQLLTRGAGNPIGNLRVLEAVNDTDTVGSQHAGFSRDDVLERQDSFIEYAWQHGALVAGSSGAQGEAPKFLLTQDHKARWHGDGALTDEHCARHWLVKFPKSARNADRRVLSNEAPYYEVARWFGVRTGKPLMFENDALFVPRFDRVFEGSQLQRLGVESLASLAGVSEFGFATSLNLYCRALSAHTTDPNIELLEFVRRDVLNIALGNTDNHGRNSAVLRYPDHRVALSPLYDFAPMLLDPQGIARLSRWENEEKLGRPDWFLVAAFLQSLGCTEHETSTLFAELAIKAPLLPAALKKAGVDDALIAQLSPRIEQLSLCLKEVAR